MQRPTSRWRDAIRAPQFIQEPGARLVNELVTALILLVIVAGLAVTALRLVVEPQLVFADLPVVALTAGSLVVNLALSRSRHARWAPLMFAFAPVWTNMLEGLTRPNGPIWYGFMPLAAILGGVLLPLRQALSLAGLAFGGAAVVVAVHADALGREKGLTIALYVGITSAVALGMAVFRGRLEAARRAEVERLSAQLAAAERLESIGRVAGGVAHDFNNLLTVILSSAEAAKAGHADALDDVLAAGARAAGLTRQLLTFSRHHGGERVTVDVDAAVREMEPLLRRLLPENIELARELAAGASVRLEPQQLEQVLLNLAANARDAMQSGGRLELATALIEVPAGVKPPRVPGEFVVLSVRDDGEGMTEKVKAHVFEPFFTTKPTGAGTGLGLATVHGIVRRAQGWLELDSAAGKGTRVTVALPSVEPEPASPRQASKPPEGFTGTALLVEDEPLVMRASARALTKLGFSVVSAPGPAAVADALAGVAGPLAVLVSDVVMPGGSGVELVATLRRRQPGLPVLLVSGYAEDDLEAALREPGVGFLAKPFTEDALAEALRRLLPTAVAPTPGNAQ